MQTLAVVSFCHRFGTGVLDGHLLSPSGGVRKHRLILIQIFQSERPEAVPVPRVRQRTTALSQTVVFFLDSGEPCCWWSRVVGGLEYILQTLCQARGLGVLVHARPAHKGCDHHVHTSEGRDSIGSVWQRRLFSYPAMLWLLPSAVM